MATSKLKVRYKSGAKRRGRSIEVLFSGAGLSVCSAIATDDADDDADANTKRRPTDLNPLLSYGPVAPSPCCRLMRLNLNQCAVSRF